MPWEEVNFTSTKAGGFASRSNEKPALITISGGKINFTAGFVSARRIENAKYVRCFIDAQNCRIGFKFLPEYVDGKSVKIDWRKRDTPSGRIGLEKLRQHKFIADAESLSDIADRRFIPYSENAGSHGEVWVIQLAPLFENSLARGDVNKIPGDASGIYRYLRDGSVVYIGKGDVRRRAQSPERQNWDFDTIQYSVILRSNKKDQNAEQFKWEKHWIRRHKEENGGARPFYNKNDGIEIEVEPD